MDPATFDPSDDPNTEAYLNGKYPNPVDDPQMAALKLFLLPKITGQSPLTRLITRLLVGTRLLVLNNLY